MRRFVIISALGGLAIMALWLLVEPYLLDAPPGDYEVRQGDIPLTDGWS